LYLHMEASQLSLLAACFTLHSINATLAIVPQRGAGLWIIYEVSMVLQPCWTLAAFTFSRTFYTVSRTPWGGGGSPRRKGATCTQDSTTE
jgi:hypothetical protein